MRQMTHLMVCAICSALFFIGCSNTTDSKSQADKNQHPDHVGHKDGDEHEKVSQSNEGHDHSGWWCNEHGVPEDVCAQCNSKLAADFQKKGDWCKEHERPDSQCFLCHQELEAKFAAKYVARYGKQPPKPEAK